jgi:hypothetical protein
MGLLTEVLLGNSESAPRELSNERSCQYASTILNLRGNFCVPPLVTSDRLARQRCSTAASKGLTLEMRKWLLWAQLSCVASTYLFQRSSIVCCHYGQLVIFSSSWICENHSTRKSLNINLKVMKNALPMHQLANYKLITANAGSPCVDNYMYLLNRIWKSHSDLLCRFWLSFNPSATEREVLISMLSA